ncbi:DsbA family protein [Solicola sp. PLA-1-18]|uniref:DsbA family protein n=1 Tax=Solicola sp. PLA-1-18 TaxID=3380532 RepID=UPI003B77ECE2
MTGDPNSGESSVQVLYDGDTHVHYGFVHLTSGVNLPDLADAFLGQRNGLLGASNTGSLTFQTGLHTGAVPVLVELHDTEPATVERFEDVVEASLTTESTDLVLATFDDSTPVTLPTGSYRARLSATGMDAAHAADTRTGRAELDSYLLQLWPAPAADDVVIRVGSAYARYRHDPRAQTIAATPQPVPPAATPPGAPSGTTADFGTIFDVVAMRGGRPGSAGMRIPADALPVVIYEDMADPGCEIFHTTVMPRLLTLITTGQLTVEHRLVAYGDDESHRFAQVAACVIDAVGSDGLHRLHHMVGGPLGLSGSPAWALRMASGIARRDIEPDVISGRFAPWVDAATAAARNSGILNLPRITVQNEQLDPQTASDPDQVLEIIQNHLKTHEQPSRGT